MKRKFVIAVLAFVIALSAAGCGEIEDDHTETPSPPQTESTGDTSSTAENSIAANDSQPDSLPDIQSAPDDSEKSNVMEIEIKSYTGDQVPELKNVIMATLNGAAGEFADFEKVFDPDILIEAQLRSLVNNEDKRQELRSQYDDESRKMTVRQNYDLLHNILSGVKFEEEPSKMTIQTISGELDDSILFELNFDIDSSAGMLTFIGKAYHIDGKWGAVFEPGEHKTKEEIQHELNKKE